MASVRRGLEQVGPSRNPRNLKLSRFRVKADLLLDHVAHGICQCEAQSGCRVCAPQDTCDLKEALGAERLHSVYLSASLNLDDRRGLQIRNAGIKLGAVPLFFLLF